MFRLFGLSITLLLSSLAITSAQDISKVKFEKSTSSKGGYSVNFPGKPISQQKTANSPIGELTINLDIVPFGQGAAFIVSFNDYPDAVKQQDPNKMLEGVRDGNKGEDGTIVEDSAIKFGPDKLPGRKIVIKKNGGLMMKNLMVFKGTRLYQAMVVGEESLIKSPELEEKFYKSFTITK